MAAVLGGVMVHALPFYLARPAAAHVSAANTHTVTLAVAFAAARAMRRCMHGMLTAAVALGAGTEPRAGLVTCVAAALVLLSVRVLRAAQRDVHDAPIGVPRTWHVCTEHRQGTDPTACPCSPCPLR